MGMSMILSGKYKSDNTPIIYKGNPVPTNYTILRTEQIGKYLIAEILYPDCQNYEGKKICVFATTIKKLVNATSIDPHFQEKNPLSPIARFEPTNRGWKAAMIMVIGLNKEKI